MRVRDSELEIEYAAGPQHVGVRPRNRSASLVNALYWTPHEIDQIPVFARLRHYGTDAAVAYKTGDGHLAVAAWRFAAPGAGGAARTVLASKAGTELPTQFRLTTLVPSDADDPVPFVTLSRATSGQLRLVSWRLKKN